MQKRLPYLRHVNTVAFFKIVILKKLYERIVEYKQAITHLSIFQYVGGWMPIYHLILYEYKSSLESFYS